MAETYKGLTIRIGADSTKLRDALKSAESAISSTQTQLSKLTRALRFDDSNTGAVTRQLELMGNKAIETYSEINRLKKAIDTIRSQKVELFSGDSVKTVGELASETQDASVRAAEALRNYNELNASLGSIYRQFNDIARASEAFDSSFDIRDDIEQFDQYEAALKNSNSLTEEQKRRLADLGDRLREIRPLWESAFDENEIAKSVLGFEQANDRLRVLELNAKETSRSFSELSTSMRGMTFSSDIDDKLKAIDKAADAASESLDRAQKALKLNPGDAQSAVSAMQNLNNASALAEQKIELLQRKLDAMDSAGIGDISDNMVDLAGSAQRASDNYEKVTQSLHEARGNLQELINTQRSMEAMGDTASSDYDQLTVAIKRAESEVRSLQSAQAFAQKEVDMSAYVSQYRETQSAVNEARASLESYQQSAKTMTSASGLSSNTLMELGMTLSTSVTPAIIGMGAASIQSANEIDSAYRDMRKTVDGTEQQFEDLRQAAIDFSMTNVTSASQVLAIQAIGGELGIATEDLRQFAETVSNIDVATDLGAEEAATALGQLSNIMGDLTSSKYPAFADALVRLGNNGASTESQIADVATRIGAMGSIMGFTTPEILAWASTIASTGQNAEAAGTAISNTMSDIEQAVASGGDKLAAFAQVAGMSSEEFASAWESTPSKAMESFIKGLNGVEENGGSATATLADLGITASRQVQAIEGLMQTVDGLDSNLQMSNDAWNGISDQWGNAGDAAEEARKKAEGFSGSLSILKNTVQVLGSEMGDALAPFIRDLSDSLADLTEWFTELPDSAKQAVAGFAALAAAMGPALLYIRAIGSAVSDLKKFATGLKAVDAASSAAQGALSGLSGGVVGLGVAIAAIGLGTLISEMARVQRNVEKMDKATSELESSINSSNASLVAASDNMAELGAQSEETALDMEAVADANLELARSVEETNAKASEQVGELSRAMQTIEQYANKSNLTTEQQGLLRSAVELVNDACGTQYSVVDAVNGVIADEEGVTLDTVDAIKQYVTAKQAQIRVDALQQNLTDAQATQVEQHEALAKAQQEYNDKLKEFTDVYGEYDEATADLNTRHAWGEVDEAKTNFDNASKAAREADEAVSSLSGDLGLFAAVADGTATDLQKFVTENANLAGGLSLSGQSFSSLSDALDRTGVSVGTLSSLSDSELTSLATNFDGTVYSIVKSLDEAGKDIPAKGLAAVLGFADGISQGTADAVNAALRVSDMTVDQFRGTVAQFGLAGEDQITAYANAIAAGDSPTVAALKSLETCNALGSYLGQYGIEGTEAINAFKQAIQNGDTWSEGLKKAQQVAQGIDAGKPEADTAAQELSSSVNSKLSAADSDGISAAWQGAVGGISGAIKRGIGSAVQAAQDAVGRINGILSGARTSVPSPSTGGSGRIPRAAAAAYQAPAAAKIASAPSIPGGEEARSMVSASYARNDLASTASSIVSRASYSRASQIGGAISKAMQTLSSQSAIGMASNGAPRVYIENQNFPTTVVRNDEDLYAVAPIIYRNAIREARLMKQ